MKLYQLSLLFFFILAACAKSNNTKEEYERLSKLANDKYLEIKELSSSKSCNETDLADWKIETIQQDCWLHFAIHKDDKEKYEKLAAEYVILQQKANEIDPNIPYYYSPCEPNPPYKIICDGDELRLVYPYEITDVDELEEEIATRKNELLNFYADIPCTNSDDWQSHFMKEGCCLEGIAMHKTIRSTEFYTLLLTYNHLQYQKLNLTKADCSESNCKFGAKPVQCVDGKPVVELTKL